MANYDFNADLKVARKTEIEVAKIIEKSLNAEILEFGNTNKWDILALIDGKEVSYEVKEDFMCWKTGNVAVEYSCRGKSSGIETTEADFYIYKINFENDRIEYVMHTTEAIKKMIAKNLYFKKVNGGDPGSNSLNYLFRYNSFVKDCVFLRFNP